MFVEPGTTVDATARIVCSAISPQTTELDYYGVVDFDADPGWSDKPPKEVLATGASGDYLTATVPIPADATEGDDYELWIRCGTYDNSGDGLSGGVRIQSAVTTTESQVAPSVNSGGTGFGGDSVTVEPVTGKAGDKVTVKPFEVECGADPSTLFFFPNYPDTSGRKKIGTFASQAHPEFHFQIPKGAKDPSAFGTVCADGVQHWNQPWGTTVIAGTQGGIGGGPATFKLPHDRSSFSASLATPADVDTGPGHVLSNLVIAALMLLLVFPAEMFNATFEENYDEITGWLKAPRGWNEKASGWLAGRGTTIAFGIVTAIAAVLYAFLDPDVGFDQASLALVLGIGASIVAAVYVAAYAARRYVASKTEDRGRVRVYPAALFVALVCVAVSRIADFQPGYLYGVVAGIAFAAELSKEDDGQTAARVAVTGLVVSFAAWLLWVPVQALASDPNPALPILVVDAFLAAVFVGGVQGVVFGFVPMRFLPGAKVWAWSKKAWLVIEGIAAFAFVQILIHPTEAYDGNLTKMIVLFGGFAALSIGFWWYFQNRASKQDAAADEAPTVTTGDGSPDG